MFNFNPFRKVSSFALSKFLTPYFSSIDESQINVGFWKGEIKLTNLELSKNFFFLNNIDLEVLYSIIHEIKIKIPWNSINSQPIEISITGVKLVISNALQRSKKQKKEMKEQLNKLKKEALSQFDQNLFKNAQGDNPVYISNLIQNLMQNAKLIIEDVNVIFVYQIRDFELVKFGLTIHSFQIGKSSSKIDDSSSLRKNIAVSKVSMFFEFYDSVHLNDKFREESPFVDLHETPDKETMRGSGEMKESADRRLLSKNYIINNFDFNVELKLEYTNGIAVEMAVTTGPILIFLKQRQLRHLTRAVQAILYFRSDRPEIKPGVSNGTILWWKYAFKRILNEEKIPLKIKNKDLLIFYKAEKYKNLYVKSKLIDSSITPKERIFLQNFEDNTSLAEIMTLRNFALQTIVAMKQKLTDESEKQQTLAKEWFEQFSIGNPLDLLGDLKLNLLKKEEKPFKFHLTLESGRIDILIQENEMLKSLKKLHNYVSVFSEALEEKKELKDKILNHIKENFVQEISNQQRFVHNIAFDQESLLVSPTSLMSKSRKKSVYNWNENINLDRFFGPNSNKIKKKMLLQLTIQGLKIRYEVNDFLSNELHMSVKSVEGIDMHKLNREYKKFLDVPKGFTLFMTSTSSKLHREGFEDWLVKINLDLNLETFQTTVCKPFIERINSLLQMVMFDPKKFYEDSLKKEKYETERQYLFFNTILLERKKVTKELNLSLNIQNINLYFPFHYSAKNNMLLIQIKDLRLYKREDQKDIKPPDAKELNNRQSSTLLSTPSTFQPMKKTLLEFNPIFLRLNCLKIMIVSDYQWEEKENLFLQNLQRLKSTGKSSSSPLRFPLNNNYTESMANNQKSTASRIILETLPISFRLEKFKTLTKIKNEEYLEFDKNIKRMHISDKEITPQTSKLSIDLPMIIVNLTISQLYSLMSLIKAWQESGPDLYKAVMDETRLSSTTNKPEASKNQPKGKGNLPSNSTQFAQRHVFIDPNINYGGCAIEEFLDSFEVSSMNFNCDGLNFSLYLKNHYEREIIAENEKHTNRLFSFFVDRISFSESQRYFQTFKEITIRKVIFQNHNCLDLDLRSQCKRIIQKKRSKDLAEGSKGNHDQRINTSFSNDSFKNDGLPPKFDNEITEKKNNEKIKGKNEKGEKTENDPRSLWKECPEEFKKPEEDSILMKLSQELSEISKIKQVQIQNESKPEINNLEQFFSVNMIDNEDSPSIKKTSKEDVTHPKACKHCAESIFPQQRRLLINSLNPSKDQTSQSFLYGQENENHIKITIKTTEKELEKFRRKKVTYSDIELKLSDFIIAIDPIVNQTIRSIIDLGNTYSDQKLNEFKQFMRNNGFWPDFMFRENNPQHESQVASLKPEVADSHLSIVMNSLTLLFHFKRQNIYVLNAKSFVFKSENFNVYSVIRLSAENLSLHDTSPDAGNHTDLIMNYEKNKISKLDIEIKLFDQNFSAIKKHSTYVGVRIMNARVIFLKRIVNEVVEYIRFHFLPSFYPQDETIPDPKLPDPALTQEPRVPSTFKLEILLMDSMVSLYQNSISNNLLFVEFDKICIWSTGLWGMEMGDLLRSGVMDFERGDKDDSLSEEPFYDIDEESPSNSPINQSISGLMRRSKMFREKDNKKQKPEKLWEEDKVFYESRNLKGKDLYGVLNEFLEGTKGFPSATKAKDEKKIENIEEMSCNESQNIDEEVIKTEETNEASGSIKEIYRIKIEGLKILTNKDYKENDAALFVKTPKDSMSIDINTDDEDFAKERIEEIKKVKGEKTYWPITIQIKLKKLWLYSYEPEFSLLMNILQENLGEIPTNVVDDSKVDLEDTRIFLFVKVLVDDALMKIYKGTREELIKENWRRNSLDKPNLLYKNSASLALISLKDINFRMLMLNNGGKKMILSISKLNMSDLRMNSKLSHYNKSILFSYVSNQFNFDENTMTTTTQEPPSPVRDVAINIDNNLNLEELNQNADFSVDPDQGMEIELNFDQKHNNQQPEPNYRENEEEKDMYSKLGNDHVIEAAAPNPIEISKNQNNYEDLPSSKRELKPISTNMKPETPKEKTWKDHVKNFFSKVFSCCKKRQKHKKKTGAISLFDLVPNNEQKDSPILPSQGGSITKKKDFYLLSPNRNNNEQQQGLRNFVIQNRLIRVSKSDPEGPPAPESFPQAKPDDYIIHNLKSVKQPEIEDNEEDDVKFFHGDPELKLVFTSRPNGEKLIKIKLSSKNLIVVIDLIGELVKFFMKPFDGTNIPPYIKKTPPFNNNPPMVVRVDLQNIYLIFLADYEIKKKPSESIALLIDLNYEHKWLGDAYVGPGSIEIVVFLFLNRFFLFNTPDFIIDEYIKGDYENKANFQFFNLLVEPFEIKFVSNYHIAFYTEDVNLDERRKYNPKYFVSDQELLSSYSEKFLTLKNPNGRKEIHLPIKKIRGMTQVLSVLTASSLNPGIDINKNQPAHPANHPPPIPDNSLLCIEQFDLMIEQINIHILKNEKKIQYGKLIFKDFRLVGIRKNENYKIKLRGTVSFDYFNKRKMDFEPLLEPWTFLLTACQVRNDIQIVLQNDQTSESDPYFVRENKNSLNLNITTAGIETILEAYKIFSYKNLDENEPCKLYNKMGCIIRYRNAKMQESRKHYWLHEHRTCDIWSKFKPKKPSKLSSKSVITHTAINVLLVNKDISNIIPEAQLIQVPEEKQNEEDPNHHKTSFHQPFSKQASSNVSTTTRAITDKRPKKMSFKTASDLNSKMSKSGNIQPDSNKKVSLLDSQPEGVALNEPTPKELETIYEISEPPMINLNKSATPISECKEVNFFKSKKKGYQSIEGLDSEKDHKLSDYRMIKDVSLDHVGKTVYRMERINRFDQNKQNNNKNIFGIDIGFDFDSLDFLSKTRKINEEGNNYMLVDVRFSPQKGYKEIFVTTSVKFLNKLNSDIEIGFYWKYKKNPLETKIIKPDHEYYIPLKFIEASTLVTFKNTRMSAFDYIHFEDDTRFDDFNDSNIEENNEEENGNPYPSPTTYERSQVDSPDNRRNAQTNALYKSVNLNMNPSTLYPPAPSMNITSNQQLKPPLGSSDSYQINRSKSPIINKGYSMNIKENEIREKAISQNTNNAAVFNRVPISAEFEKHDLDKFICDKVPVGEFEQVDEHELYKKEHTKKGLLVYKNDFVVNSIHHHGKASYGNFYFILSCVKSKMETQKRHNKEREEVCYETTLILLPIFKITNLTMNNLTIEYGGFANTSNKKKPKSHDDDHKYSKKTLYPKSSYGCSDIYYGEDLSFNVSFKPSEKSSEKSEKSDKANKNKYILKSKDIRIYKYEKNLHVPIKLKANSRIDINKMQDIREYRKNFYLWAEFKKTSPKSREIIIFCPYLIIDETNKLMFKESSSFLNPKKYFKSNRGDKHDNSMRGTMNLSQNFDHQEIQQKEDLFYEIDKAHNDNPQLKDRVKKEMETYHKIHMFSSSKKMKAIQIALKDSLKQWSKPCPLHTTEDVLTVVEAPTDRDNVQQDKANNDNRYDNMFNNFLNIAINRQQTKAARKKYQFGVKITPAPHPFFRSQMIVFTPRYIIKNECDNLIAIAQYDTEHSEDDIIRIRKDNWQEFHWTDHKKKEYLVMSLCNKVTGNVYGWSGRFKIDKVQELVVKLRKNQDNEYEFTKVSINIYDNVQCIRIMNEDRDNPPYSLHNETNHEIAFRHKIKIGNKRNQEEVPFTILYPGDSVNFTWEQWDDENDRILQVEIDGQLKEYSIEKTQECEPFILNPPRMKNINKQIKTHIYKKGYLQRQNEKKKKDDYYCVLSVANQKMKLYEKDNSKKTTINLKGAKIENALENDFILKTAKNVTYQFVAKTDSEKSDWVNHIWKSILLENPEIIFVKIEPENLTKAIKFHSEGEDFLLPYRDEEGDEQERVRNKRKETTYTFSISNAIGISIIDSLPREIVHLSIKKIELSFFSVECVNNDKQGDITILVEKGDTIVKTSWINLSVDSFIINNQIMDAQFPVIMAPNKKKLNENQQFIMAFIQTKTTVKPPAREQKEQIIIKEMNIGAKDSKAEIIFPPKEQQRQEPNSEISSLTYVEQMKIVFDSIEVRVEDLLIEALYDFYLEISPALNNIEIKDESKMATPFDIRTLETKLDGRLKQNSNRSKQMVYIKGMLFHPIEICFSFRDNPGQQKNSLMKSWGSYLGISFISIDSAKIKLGMLDQLHFFGSWDEVSMKISKHYKKNLWNQLKKLFFSMDILGNPYSLGESVAVGLKEMVLNPMQDLVKWKFDKFGKGIALGSVGFVKNTLTSVYISLERILGTFIKTFSKMTRDKEYLYGRQIMKNRAIKRVREGVYMGVKNLFKVNADVVIGIPRLIGNEMRQNGCFLGLVIGLYDCGASIIVKPVVGFYDLFTAIIEGIKNSDKYEGHIMEIRSRPPRIFNSENLVVPYNYNPAMLKLLIMKYKLREIDSERVEYFDEFTVQGRDFILSKFKETTYQVILTDYRLLFAEKMSAIFCKKISLHKIQDIHYDKKNNKFVFKFQVPMQRKYYCQFKDMDFKMPIGSEERAKVLGKALKKLRQKGELEFKNKEKDEMGKNKQNFKDNLDNMV